jgi:hypothetical protein
MAISDIFSTSFLFSIGIIFILIGGIYIYFSQRFNEQDHKLNSMLGLISTMAAETQYFRSKLSQIQQKINLNDDPLTPVFNGGSLIDVSDDEYEQEDEDTEDDEDDEDTEDEDQDDEDEDQDTEDQDTEVDEDQLLSDEIEDLGQLINETNEIIKTVHLESPIGITNLDDNITLSNNDFLKNISMSELEEIEDSQKTTDYKKMSLNKLRDIAVSTGLATDASKLKKNDILKLLNVF